MDMIEESQIVPLIVAELPDKPTTILPQGESGEGDAVVGGRIISPAEFEEVKAGRLWMTFSILIEYEDDFSIIHHAETCSLFTQQPYNSVCPWPARND